MFRGQFHRECVNSKLQSWFFSVTVSHWIFVYLSISSKLQFFNFSQSPSVSTLCKIKFLFAIAIRRQSPMVLQSQLFDDIFCLVWLTSLIDSESDDEIDKVVARWPCLLCHNLSMSQKSLTDAAYNIFCRKNGKRCVLKKEKKDLIADIPWLNYCKLRPNDSFSVLKSYYSPHTLVWV